MGRKLKSLKRSIRESTFSGRHITALRGQSRPRIIIFIIIAMVFNFMGSYFLFMKYVYPYPDTPRKMYVPTGECKETMELAKKEISSEELGKRFQESPHQRCKCESLMLENGNKTKKMDVESTCSDAATWLGKGQNVISYSDFPLASWLSQNGMDQNVSTIIWENVRVNLRLMAEYYPGWVMRVYSKQPFTPEICSVICDNEHLYVCDAHQLPGFGDVTRFHPSMWNLLVLGDPTVQRFVIRNIDTRLSKREADAVIEWENYNFPLHAMRDHPSHGFEIEGGLWGGHNEKLCRDLALEIRDKIVKEYNETHSRRSEPFLYKYIYAEHKTKMWIHDSYWCQTFSDGFPFPSRRLDRSAFVGQSLLSDPDDSFIMQPCPKACMPADKDWKYC